MPNPVENSARVDLRDSIAVRGSSRISVQEIAWRLDIGRLAVYDMLKTGTLPGVLVGRKWLITRHAYERWERTCGGVSVTGLRAGT